MHAATPFSQVSSDTHIYTHKEINLKKKKLVLDDNNDGDDDVVRGRQLVLTSDLHVCMQSTHIHTPKYLIMFLKQINSGKKVRRAHVYLILKSLFFDESKIPQTMVLFAPQEKKYWYLLVGRKHMQAVNVENAKQQQY